VDDATLPTVAVVVTALDDADRIADCVASLLRQDYPADRREVVVVDRGSTDATRSAAGVSGARLVDGARLNVSAARNSGAGATGAEIIAFTDPDCVAETRWLSALVREFADARVGTVAGAIVPFPPRTTVERYAARRRSHSAERSVRHAFRPFGLGPNLAIRRDALKAVGGFDVRFPGGGWEDADFCWRLERETPYRLAYAERATVFHRYRATALEFFVQHYRYGYGLGLLCRKYPGELATAGRTLSSPAAKTETSGARRSERLAFAFLDFVRAFGQRTGAAAARCAS
jgi:GT2 family glycosyltransferase